MKITITKHTRRNGEEFFTAEVVEPPKRWWWPFGTTYYVVNCEDFVFLDTSGFWGECKFQTEQSAIETAQRLINERRSEREAQEGKMVVDSTSKTIQV